MELDIVSGLEQLKPEMSKYANSLCKALGMSVAEVDEIVQRTMVDVWQISQRDGSNPTYDKRRGTVKPSFETTYEGNREYKKWVLARLKWQSKRLLKSILAEKAKKHEVSLTGMEDTLTNDCLPAQSTSVPKYDWE